MSIKHELQRCLYTILKHNRDGSFATQEARRKLLMKAASDLSAGHYKLRHINGLKQKHIRYLNELWKTQGKGAATIKNRNSHLRWLCQKIDKRNIVPSNDELGIGKRQYSHNNPTAVELSDIDFNKVTNRNILVQIHLQRHFGLRREESCKIKPHLADKGDHLDLKSSWCKGGRARTVPILTAEARYWLEEAKKLVSRPEHSMIPPDKTYEQHKELYDNQLKRAGTTDKHPHGLRHAYAQERYEKLTGWKCPKQGGPISKELTAEQKQQDRIARLEISEHLGHSRESVTVIYLGR